VQVPIAIYSDHAFLETHQRSQLGLGIYYGVLIGLLLYNLLIFVSVRDRSYPYYVGYVALFGLGLACLNGISYQILWPNWPIWDDAVLLLAIGGSLTCMLLFTHSFLELPKRQPRLGRVVRGAAGVLGAITLASPFLTYRHAILLETASVFLLGFLMIGVGVSAWRKGYRPAYYFLLAWSFMIAGIVVYASVSFGLLPKNFVTEYGIQFGSSIEMILLSLGLAYRFKLLREQNLMLQLEATERLEVRVEERTNELNRAMGELRTANRRLHEFSLRDGLTGVHNRRYLDETLAHAVAQARERKAPIALLMIDIDHFKRINDHHGHLAGDAVLREAALRMRDALPAEARFGRWGGEEFIAVLPDIAPERAGLIAERVRHVVAAQPFRVDGAELAVSISIGVASAPRPERRGIDRLIATADAALYRAKHAGRNRVEVG
jgi:diguanylate cyclase (GGDEF)-like protein